MFRLDLGIQNFTAAKITDLKIVDIGPKYPIFLGDEFFKRIGLTSLATIKISNCTIDYISKSAFAGLNDLITVDLSYTTLQNIPQNVFADNILLKKLRLNGNDLSDMQSKVSPYAQFMLNVSILIIHTHTFNYNFFNFISSLHQLKNSSCLIASSKNFFQLHLFI